LRPDQTATAQSNARWLAQHPNIRFTIEGHCDERGSTEYNIALGDNRAQAVINALSQAGVAADRMRKMSFGKEKPFCSESTEDCWQQNRRGHFVYQK
jgi:peptidoglycan-associated lipoprotein